MKEDKVESWKAWKSRGICPVDDCTEPKASHGLCQMHRRRVELYGDPFLLKPFEPQGCLVEGCTRKHKAHGLCFLHNRRKQKGLPMDYVRPKLNPKRYVLWRRMGHLLADVHGNIYAHRMILFEHVKGQDQNCYWCGIEVVWRETLVVDHYNHDRQDNRIENLVPSCVGCNAGRTRANPRIRTEFCLRGHPPHIMTVREVIRQFEKETGTRDPYFDKQPDLSSARRAPISRRISDQLSTT